MLQIIDPRLCSRRFANADGGAEVSTTSGSDGGSKWWQNSEMWSAIGSSFSSLTDMFGSIFSGAGSKTDTVSNAGAAYIVPSQNTKKNNTWIWLVGVAVVAVVAVVLLRKFKK